jgi:hypothetical protein
MFKINPSLKPSSCVLAISAFLFFLLAFSYYSVGVSSEPDIILVGNPEDLSPSLRQKLPVGYRWIEKEQTAYNYLEITGNMEEDMREFRNNPQIIFRFDESLDMEGAIQYARENGKREIYLSSARPNPETMVPLSIDEAYTYLVDSLAVGLKGLEWIIDPFFIKDAFADPVEWALCMGVTPIFPNTCIPTTAGDSAMEFCFMYEAYECHYYPWMLHAGRNIDSNIDNGANVNNSTWVSLRTAMDYMGNPMEEIEELEITIYSSNLESGFRSDCNTTNPNVIACGQCPNCGDPSKPSPIPHEGEFIILADNTTRNNWGVVRHEIAHTYNYEHCEIDLDFDNIARSINSHGQGSTVAKPLAGCQSIGREGCRHNPNVCSIPGVLEFPNNIYY